MINYYNDSLENDNYEEEEEEKEEKEEKLDKNNVEEIIEVKKDESKKTPIKAKEEDIPISKDILKIDENKEKVIYQNNKKDSNDKTSFAHSIIFEGEDIDITRKKVYECLEQTGTNFIIFKKKNKNENNNNENKNDWEDMFGENANFNDIDEERKLKPTMINKDKSKREQIIERMHDIRNIILLSEEYIEIASMDKNEDNNNILNLDGNMNQGKNK